MTCVIKLLTNFHDPPVHHVRRGNQVDTGRGLQDRHLGKDLDGFIIENLGSIR